MNHVAPRWQLAALLVATSAAWGADTPAASTEISSADIAVQRAAVNARYADAIRGCQERFVVTSCVNEVRKEHNRELSRLQKMQDAKDDAQRKQKALLRQKDIEARQLEQTRRDAAPTPARGSASQVLATSHPPRAHESRPTAPARSASARLADETRKTQAFEKQQQEITAHREAVERRNAARAASGKVAAPLPVPATAPASAPAAAASR